MSNLQAEAKDIAKDGWNPFKGLGSFADFFGSIFCWFRQAGMLILMCLFFSLLYIYILFKLIQCICNHTTQQKDPTQKILSDHGQITL